MSPGNRLSPVHQIRRLIRSPALQYIRTHLAFSQCATRTIMSGNFARDQPHGFTNHIEKVAVIGGYQGGGRVGKHLLDQVLKVGNFSVTAIQRPNSTNELPKGVKVIRADYGGDDDSTLVEALKGQQALIITMAVTAPRDTISKLARAAAKAGVSYILPNWYGHDPNNDSLCEDSMLAQRRDAITAEIKSLGVSSYLLIVCNFWYEFSLGGGLDRFGFDFQKRSLVWFDDGNVKFNTTTWPQCGRAVANILSLKLLPDSESDNSTTLSQFANGPAYVSSFLVSQRDIFESVKRVTKTTDADWSMSKESPRQRWEEGTAAVQKGDYSQYTKMLYSRMFFPGDDGDYQSRKGLDNDALSLPVEDLDEWTAVAVRMGENGEVDV